MNSSRSESTDQHESSPFSLFDKVLMQIIKRLKEFQVRFGKYNSFLG